MAEHTIDELELKIQSDAKSASDGLERLVQSLTGLKDAVGKGQGGLSDFAKKLQDFNKSINGLSDTEKVSKSLGDIEKSVRNLSKTPVKMNFDNIDSAIDQLREKFKDAGVDFKIDGNTASIERAIESTTAQLDKLLAREDKIRAIGGNFNTEGFKSLEYDISVAYNKLDALRDKLEEIQTEGKPLKFTDEWLANLPSMKEEAARTAESISEEFQNIQYINPESLSYSKSLLKAVGMDETLKDWNQAVEKFGENTAAQLNIADTAMEKGKINAENFREVLNSLKDIQPRIDETGLDRLQNKLKNIEHEKERLEYELEKGLRLGKIDVDDKAYQSLEIKIREAENTAEALRQKIAEVSNQAAISSREAASQFEQNLKNLKIPPINENNLQKLQASLRKMESDLDKFRAKLENDITMGRIVANVDDSGYRKAREQIELTERSIEETKRKIASLDGTQGQNAFNGLSDSMSKVANVSKSVTIIFANIGKSAKSLFSRIRSLVPSFREIGTAVKNLITRMGKLGKAFVSFAKSHKKTDMSLKDGIKTILKYSLGIRSLFVLFNRLRSAAKEGLDNLVQYSDEVNKSVSLITSALGGLKNGFSVAFAPILNAVAPLITRFINLMIDASNAVARFFAALQGKTIATQAKKYYKDYADSLNGVADAAKKADKALHTLGIDELNIINEVDEETDDQITIEDMFEDVAIEGKIADWAKGIRDAFLSHDWEGLGKNIADLINKGLKRLYDLIKWDNVGNRLTKAISAFTETFNSLVDNLDWDLLGRTIGAGIDTLAHAFNLLVEGIDFENLGRKLSVGLRGMVDEIDWGNLGNALGNGWMVAWRILDGFISDMARKSNLGLTGFQELGIALGDLVNGIFEKVNFETVGRVLANGLNGIFEIIDKFAETVRFKEIAENLKSGINTFISLSNMGDWGAAIGKSIHEIVSALNELAEGIRFVDLGTKLADGFRNLVTGINFKDLGNLIGNAVMTIWNILKGAVDELSRKVENMTGWQEIGKSIGDEINGIFDKVNFTSIGTTITKGINGIFESLKQAVDAIRWSDIADNFSDGLNNIIHGIKWKNNGQTINQLMTELLQMLLDAVKKVDWESLGKGIGDFLSQIDWKKHLGTIFEIIKETFGGLIDGLKETVAGKIGLAVGTGVLAFKGFEQIVPIVTAIFGPKGGIIAAIVAGLGALITTMAIGGKDLAISASDLIKGLLDKLIDAVRNTDWGQVWKNIIEFLGNFDSFGIIGKLIALGIELVGHLVAGLIEGLITADWGSIAKNLIDGLIQGVKAVVGALIQIPKLIFEAIVNGIKSLFGIHSPSTVMAELGTYMVQGLIEGIKSLIGDVIAAFAEIKEKISAWVDEVKGFFSAEKWAEIYSVVSAKFQDAWNRLVEFWQNTGFGQWWSEYVSPWFTADKWVELYDVIHAKFKDAWTALQNWWSNTNFGQWWGEKVQPWFTKDKWQELYGVIHEKFESAWNTLVEAWQKTGFSDWWENHVSPWFTADKWSDLYKVVREKLQNTWETAKEWWQNNALSQWWREQVSPWFEKGKWKELYSVVHDKLQSTWEGLTSWWDGTGGFSGWYEGVQEWFEDSKWGEMYRNVKDKLVDTWDGLQSWWKETGGFKGWYEDVTTWFEESKWSDMYKNVKGSLVDTWEGLLDWWNGTNGFSGWYDDIKSWFEESKWSNMYGIIKEKLENTWDNLTTWWEKNGFSKWFDGVKKLFSADNWADAFSGIKEGLKKAWDKAVGAVGGFISDITSKFKFFSIDSPLQVPIQIAGISTLSNSISPVAVKVAAVEGYGNAFATYGTPITGDSISTYANDFNTSRSIAVLSSGTKAADSFDSKDMAINSADIILGVERAIESVMIPYLADIAQNTRETADKDNNTYIDSRILVGELDSRRSRNGWDFAMQT